MKKVRYGVDGLIEWHISLPVGRLLLNIEFNDGRISGYGVAPATYETSDPVVQKAIERSPQFRSGRIRIVSLTEDDAEATPAKRIIDVPDWNSARLQLMRMTGLPATALRSRTEMMAAAEKHDIELRTPSPR